MKSKFAIEYKKSEIWEYFNEYINKIDPESADLKNDDLPESIIFERPHKTNTCGCSIKSLWDDKGMALIVDGEDNGARLVRYIMNNETIDFPKGIGTFGIKSQIAYSEKDDKIISGRAFFCINKLPISEFLDLPLAQNKERIERLAKLQIEFKTYLQKASYKKNID